MQFPKNLLTKIRTYLENEKVKATKRFKQVDLEDPFRNQERLTDNAAIDAEASEEAGHDRVEAIRQEIASHLSRIDRALGRLHKGKYGLCENCGKPIDAKRLKVLPTATLCMSCERKREKPE